MTPAPTTGSPWKHHFDLGNRWEREFGEEWFGSVDQDPRTGKVEARLFHRRHLLVSRTFRAGDRSTWKACHWVEERVTQERKRELWG